MSSQGSKNELDNLDLTLRPQRWEDYVGQEKVKKISELSLRQLNKETNRQSTCSFMEIPAWEKQLSPI